MEPQKGLPPGYKSGFRISREPNRHFGPFLSVRVARPKTGENGAQKAAYTAQLAHLDACGSGSNLVSARLWTVAGGSRPQVVRRRPLGPQLRDRFAKTGVVAQNLNFGSKNRFAQRLVGLVPANGRC